MWGFSLKFFIYFLYPCSVPSLWECSRFHRLIRALFYEFSYQIISYICYMPSPSSVPDITTLPGLFPLRFPVKAPLSCFVSCVCVPNPWQHPADYSPANVFLSVSLQVRETSRWKSDDSTTLGEAWDIGRNWQAEVGYVSYLGIHVSCF